MKKQTSKFPKTINTIVLIIVALVIAFSLILFARSEKVQSLLTMNYHVGCTLGVIDKDLCPLLPRITKAIESAKYEGILDLQEGKEVYSCYYGDDWGSGMEPCRDGEERYLVTGYDFGYVGSEYFTESKDRFLESVTKVMTGKEYSFYGIKSSFGGERLKNTWVFFADEEQREVIVLVLEKAGSVWRIGSFLLGDFKYSTQ